MLWTKFELFSKKIQKKKSETIRAKFCGNNFLGKGFRKTLTDSFFLNSDVASGGGGVWGGMRAGFGLGVFGNSSANNYFSKLFLSISSIVLPSLFFHSLQPFADLPITKPAAVERLENVIFC